VHVEADPAGVEAFVAGEVFRSLERPDRAA